jgi:hypothetical protein
MERATESERASEHQFFAPRLQWATGADGMMACCILNAHG